MSKRSLLARTDRADAGREYADLVGDLLENGAVRSMGSFIQHGDITCLEHSLYVSFLSYLACKRLGLDFRSAARGALLHDFFLYDWHDHAPEEGPHGIVHPRISLRNAEARFELNRLERQIIRRHMWPVTLLPPTSPEAIVVCAVDKYCAVRETARFGRAKRALLLRALLAC